MIIIDKLKKYDLKKKDFNETLKIWPSSNK